MAPVAVFVLSASWQHVGWQNAVRSVFGQDPISPVVLLPILALGAVVAAVILVVARSLRKLFQLASRGMSRVLPRRLSLLLGGIAVVVLSGGYGSSGVGDSCPG